MKLNNDIPDKIMERIRKLMRLKESTTSEGEARETALTCCHDALIDKYLEKIGTGTSKAHPRKTGTDRSAYYSGMGDGRNISLNRQIKGRGIRQYCGYHLRPCMHWACCGLRIRSGPPPVIWIYGARK